MGKYSKEYKKYFENLTDKEFEEISKKYGIKLVKISKNKINFTKLKKYIKL
jgi:hypothetical protein